MKKILFSIIMLISVVNIYSQNPHYEFLLTNNPITSAVTIIHSDQFGYILSTKANNINVSIIDPTNMQPIGSTYQFECNIFKEIKFQGAFEDLDNNLVAYGIAKDANSTYYIIFKIRTDFTNRQILYDIILPCDPIYDPFLFCNGIIEGCSGYDINGEIVNLFLLKTGEVFFTDNSYNSVYQDNLQCVFPFDKISDISWNPFNKEFVASGYSDEYQDPFLIFFDCSINAPYFIINQEFRLTSQLHITHAEGRTLHEVIDDQNIILCQDLRKGDIDYIWLTLLNPNIVNSKLFFFYPSRKLFNYDMKFDKNGDVLTILGRSVGCGVGVNFLAQINPYTLDQLNVAQIRDPNNPNYICPGTNSAQNQIFLRRLELNPYNSCHTILSTGTFCSAIYMTETEDISLTNCDNIQQIQDMIVNPIIDVFNSQIIHFNPSISFHPTQVNLLNLAKTEPCDDIIDCSSKGNNQIDNTLIKNELLPSILFFDNNKFIVENFNGKLHYYIYDVTGKLLINGITESDKINTIDKLIDGFYILKIENSKGEKLVKKFTFSN